jgi:hypothetical protein
MKNAQTSATLSVTPTDPSVGDHLVFTGDGYKPGVGVTITLQSPTALAFFGALADADGHFTSANTEDYPASQAGSYTASAYQSGGRKPVALLSFTVS